MLPIATCHTLRQLFPICQELRFLYTTGRASFVIRTLINTGTELCVWMLPRQGGRARCVLGHGWWGRRRERQWMWQGWSCPSASPGSCCHTRLQLCSFLRQQNLPRDAGPGVGRQRPRGVWMDGKVAGQKGGWTGRWLAGSTSQELSSITPTSLRGTDTPRKYGCLGASADGADSLREGSRFRGRLATRVILG